MGKKQDEQPQVVRMPGSCCQISDCPNMNLISQLYDNVHVTLCAPHTNRLVAYVGHTQQHEDFLIASSAFRKAMSPFPQSTGLGSDAEAVSYMIEAENAIRDIVNGWLADPDQSELDFRNEEG